MRKVFLLLGTVGAIGNFSLIVWEAFSMASTQGGAIVASFQKGFITAFALLGPMLATYLVREVRWPTWGRVALAVPCFAVVFFAMAFNAKQSLDAMMKTTDATIAERAKAKDAATRVRDELKRLQALPPLAVPPATAEALRGADEALKAAMRIRIAECGEENERQGHRKCADSQRDERAAREALATVTANKTATDEAAKVAARKEVLEAQLRQSPSVLSADPAAAVWDKLFGIDPELGRTWQGIAGVVLIEILIALALFAFEALRREPDTPPIAVVIEPTPVRAAPIAAAPVAAIEATTPAAPFSIIAFAGRELECAKRAKLEFDEFYQAYSAAAAAAGARALSPCEAIEPTQRLCAECDIRILSVGPNKYLVGVRLKDAARKQRTSDTA